MQWFTSDHHFGHNNVINYCDRPFLSADHMDQEMIAKWNQMIKPKDTVWYLGDFSFRSKAKSIEILNILNGTKILVKGNHDGSNNRMKEIGFSSVIQSAKIEISANKGRIKFEVNLSHYPYRYVGSNKEHQERFHDRRLDDNGKFLLCGHIHEKWRTKQRMINVGVDVWNFFPVSEETICKTIENLREYTDGKVIEDEKSKN